MRIVCARDTEEAAIKQRLCQELKATCKADLDTALPALNSAVDALKSLSKGDIGEIKAMKSPPKGVKLVMEAVCIMFDLKPDRVTSEDGKSKVNDYWKPAQKLLADMRFLQNCFEYDKDNIKPEIVATIAPFMTSPDFEPKVIEKVSRAANGLCKWVRAMYIYSQVAAIVEPKRAKLKEAQAELEVTEAMLKEKQTALKVVSDRVATLEASFALTLQEQQDLKNQVRVDRKRCRCLAWRMHARSHAPLQVSMCETKLIRAEKLISGLGGESVRWTAQLQKLNVQSNSITGDSLLSAAIVS
jgi:dynein heavy chain